MAFEYNGFIHRDLEPQVRYDAEQVQLLKQADVTINENLQTVNESLQNVNTEINGKLTKPTNPSAESAVTMLADGTVGTKPLSEFGGGKLYLHNITLVYNDKYIYFYIYSSTNTHFEIENLQNYFHSSPIFATLVNEMGQEYAGVLYCSVSFFGFTGTITDDSGELPSSWSIYALNIPYSQCVVEYLVVEL